jgi:NitT/TauT family transport system substrate-binding protein
MNGTIGSRSPLLASLVVAVLAMVLLGCGATPPAATPPAEATPAAGGTPPAATPDGTPQTTAAPVDPPTLQAVNFTLNWFPLADHAPNYVAIDNGWFEEDGLGVNIIHGSGSGTSIRRVETGQADIGIADVGVLINAIRGGANLKIIWITIDQGTAAIYAHTDRGIDHVNDLAGLTIAAPPEDAGRLIFPALAAANDLDAASVEWVDIQPAAQWQILAQGQVDAILSATTQMPFAEEALGGPENVTQLAYADYGVDLYSQAIFTSDRMIAERPDVLEKFLDSVARGWAYTFEDPDGALEVLRRYAPQIDIDAYRGNLALVLEHNRTPRFAEHGMGWVDEEKLQNTVNIIQEYMGGDAETISDLTQIYTNEFRTDSAVPPTP